MRDPVERVRDMLEAIERIARYTVRGREEFDADELIQSWCVRHIQVIGEAARALPEDFRNQAPDIPWRQIIGMRHILVHDYFGIDTDAVWAVVTDDLTELECKLQALLEALGESR
ncbi:MAG: DUF86 domain-containing protein [Candidatus Sumerlaeia bacterium]|nr:DUF86 domain-containing protein [Candidatus Sumerlaeia bacterium]